MFTVLVFLLCAASSVSAKGEWTGHYSVVDVYKEFVECGVLTIRIFFYWLVKISELMNELRRKAQLPNPEVVDVPAQNET